MIGNAHLDPAWMWEWAEGMEAFIATCRSALDRMDENPDVVFTCSSAAHYQWIEEVDPPLFARIKERIAEGRWEVVGGWWTQADCNLPSGEGFVRQALLGQRYFAEKLGVRAIVGYSPDAFGHNAGLPQLLAGAGLDSYIFCRPDPAELELPSPLFRWYSPDGSSVLAYRVPLHYNMYQTSVPKKIADMVQAFREPSDLVAEEIPLKAFGDEWAVFYGVGNHGGGPTREHIRQIVAAREDPEQPDVRFSALGAFFSGAMADSARNIPEWREDLQQNAPGCYSVHSAMKRLNRRAENDLVRAEILYLYDRFPGSGIREGDAGEREQREAFTRAWRNVCFNHFHDILCGVAIPDALASAEHLYGEAIAIADRSMRYALRRIAGRIDTGGDGQTLVLFNPNGFDLDDYVTFELWHDIDKDLWSRPVPVSITDDRGNELPVGPVRSSGKIGKDRIAGVFRARIPAGGWSCYRVDYGRESVFSETRGLLHAGPAVLENELLRVEFSGETGGIASLVHKASGLDLVDGAGGGAALPVVLRDETDTWGHGTERFDEVLGAFHPVDVRLVENTPVHGAVRVTSRWGNSSIMQEFTLHAGSDVVHVNVRILQAEPRTMIKLAFPANLSDAVTVVQAAYTSTEKPVDGIERPCGAWKSIVGTAGDTTAGIGIADNLVHGYSADGGTLFLTVLRSPGYATHDPHRIAPDEDVRYIDMGEVEFRYTVRPFVGHEDFRTTLWKDAMRLNRPPLISLESGHDGGAEPLPREYRGIESSVPNVQVAVMKVAEDGAGAILRMFETGGREAEGMVSVPILQAEVPVRLRPHQVKTFRIDAGQVVEVNLLEEPPTS